MLRVNQYKWKSKTNWCMSSIWKGDMFCCFWYVCIQITWQNMNRKTSFAGHSRKDDGRRNRWVKRVVQDDWHRWQWDYNLWGTKRGTEKSGLWSNGAWNQGSYGCGKLIVVSIDYWLIFIWETCLVQTVTIYVTPLGPKV